LVHSSLLEKPSGRANNFPQKGRDLGHVTSISMLSWGQGSRLEICFSCSPVRLKAWS